jgi:hypothetical protein
MMYLKGKPNRVIMILTHGDILQQQLQHLSQHQIQSYAHMQNFISHTRIVTVTQIGSYIVDLFLTMSDRKIGYTYNNVHKDPNWIVEQIMSNKLYFRQENDPISMYWDVPMETKNWSINYTHESFADVTIY